MEGGLRWDQPQGRGAEASRSLGVNSGGGYIRVCLGAGTGWGETLSARDVGGRAEGTCEKGLPLGMGVGVRPARVSSRGAAGGQAGIGGEGAAGGSKGGSGRGWKEEGEREALQGGPWGAWAGRRGDLETSPRAGACGRVDGAAAGTQGQLSVLR